MEAIETALQFIVEWGVFWYVKWTEVTVRFTCFYSFQQEVLYVARWREIEWLKRGIHLGQCLFGAWAFPALFFCSVWFWFALLFNPMASRVRQEVNSPFLSCKNLKLYVYLKSILNTLLLSKLLEETKNKREEDIYSLIHDWSPLKIV